MSAFICHIGQRLESIHRLWYESSPLAGGSALSRPLTAEARSLSSGASGVFPSFMIVMTASANEPGSKGTLMFRLRVLSVAPLRDAAQHQHMLSDAGRCDTNHTGRYASVGQHERSHSRKCGLLLLCTASTR